MRSAGAPELYWRVDDDGVLHVFDNANLFSAEGIKKAESAMSATSFDRGLVFTVETFRDVPDDRKAEYEAAKGDPGKKAAFFESWATPTISVLPGVQAAAGTRPPSVPVTTQV